MTLEARAVLTGTGNSVHAAASTASGYVHGRGANRGHAPFGLAEWTGVDVLTALSLNLSRRQFRSPALRCAVTSFGAKDGVLTAQRFVIDTDPVRIDGGGAPSILRDETLDLRLQGKPKNFQIVRARAPITVKGSIGQPGAWHRSKAVPLVTQGGITRRWASSTRWHRFSAFIDLGLAKDANCAPLLAEATGKGRAGKDLAVRNAPAPRK